MIDPPRYKANTSAEYECPQCATAVRLPDWADMVVCPSCGSTLARVPQGEETHAAVRPVPEEALQPASAGTWDGAAAPADGPAGGAPTETHLDPGEEVLRSVRCSQCAGPLSAREGRRILICSHCGVRTAVREHGGLSRWYLPAHVDRLKALGAAAKWLEGYPGIDRRAREAPLGDAQLVYVPIWEYKALVAGWEFGHTYRTRYELVGDKDNERLELNLVREGVRAPSLQERRLFEAATDPSRIRATRPRITGRESMLPLLAGELDSSAIVLEAEGAAEDVAATGRRAVLMPVSGAASPDVRMFALRESTSLLYYPLWLLRYEHGNASCHMVVNARDGTVNSAVFPASTLGRTLPLIAETAALVALIGMLIWLAWAARTARAPMIVGAVIVFVLMVALIRRSRFQREVEYHEPFSS